MTLNSNKIKKYMDITYVNKQVWDLQSITLNSNKIEEKKLIDVFYAKFNIKGLKLLPRIVIHLKWGKKGARGLNWTSTRSK